MIPISLTTYPTGVRLDAGSMEKFNKPKKERADNITESFYWV